MLRRNRFGDRCRCRRRDRGGCARRRRVRRVRAQPGAVQEARARGDRPGHRGAAVHRLPAARGRRVADRPAMRVLLTGAAGFIGSRVAAALADAGHDVVAVDAMLAAAHGAGAEPPEGVQRVDVRDAGAVASLLDGVDVVCHQAAVVGAGVDAADAPSYGSHNDYATTVLLAEMFAAGCQRLVLASSMVVYGQGRFSCAEHGARRPAAADARGPGRRGLRAPLPDRRRAVGVATGRRGCPAAAAQPVRGEQGRAGELRAGVGGGNRRLGGRAALPQRLRPEHAARHPVLRGCGDLPLGTRSRRRAKGFRGRRADAGLRPRRRHRRRQRRGGQGEPRRLHAGQRVFGQADLDPGGGQGAV